MEAAQTHSAELGAAPACRADFDNVKGTHQTGL